MVDPTVRRLSRLLLSPFSQFRLQLTKQILKPQQSPGGAEEEVVLIVAIVVIIEAAAETAEAVNPATKTKTKTRIPTPITPQPTKNHIKRVLDTLTGPQTPVVVAIGLKVVQRPTVQIRWSVVGPLSSLQDKRIIQIEK